MKRNVKVIDEHNIDRNANIVFALELEGSEYVVYWIERDEESNNLFVSKVLKNIDGTYNMMNIDDSDKKKDIAEIVKTLIFNSVSDQNDKMVGTTTTLADGKSVRFVNVMFNKEQNINVPKTYITTVKKEVTKVAETYYDVVVEEAKVEEVLPSVTPVVETPAVVQPTPVAVPTETVQTPVAPQPAVVEPVVPVAVQPTPVLIQPEVVVAPVLPETPVAVVPEPVAAPTPVVQPAPVEVVPPVVQAPVVEPTPVQVAAPVAPQPVVAEPVAPVAVQPTPVLIQPEVVAAPVLPETPVAVVPEPVAAPTPVVQPVPVEVVPPVVQAPVVETTPVQVAAPVAPQPVVTEPVAPAVVQPTPVAVPTEIVQTPVAQAAPVETAPQGLVFNAAKEKNLNAALGEVASSTTIPVENIASVREFGVEDAVPQTAPVVQPTPEVAPVASADTTATANGNGGFANSKFFMVVAIAFFLASCIFLGYEVYNYFQLVK